MFILGVDMKFKLNFKLCKTTLGNFNPTNHCHFKNTNPIEVVIRNRKLNATP